MTDDATTAQINAANPLNSTWLSANAGSGKTRVLTDRVARLLLAQVPPERILCLTYTKAAASEMQNRLFSRLGEWAMLPDPKLREALSDLGVSDDLKPSDLRRARTLFAAAIEAPGGLKIQTIHSFCSSILRRFPLEAGVSPQFKEIEDRAAALLRDDIVEEMAQSDQADLITDLAHHAAVHDLTELTGEIVNLRAHITQDVTQDAVRALFGLGADATHESVLSDLLEPATKDVLRAIIQEFAKGSASYQKLAVTLQSLHLDAPQRTDMDTLIKVFVDSKGELKVGRVPQANHTKMRDAVAEHLPALDGFIERLGDAIETFNALDQVMATVALNRFASAFLTTYDTRKQELGWLDFDDLILKTRDLLNDPKVAAWVLYRLDGGIDHILVDEAQDTSPDQWAVRVNLTGCAKSSKKSCATQTAH